MFSSLQISVQIYPGDEYKLYYNLYPLLSGFVALPPLHLKCTGSKALENQLKEEILEDLVTRHLPSHIYVLVRVVPLNFSFFGFILIEFIFVYSRKLRRNKLSR